ncbi:hypothetical protein L596_008192 [Steinernema carpocapsae]|nr:hypothetical protein L596_008192 [Steinernema carpocapsae]
MDPKGFSSNELHILNCGSCRDGIMDKASVSREGAVNVLSVESLGRTSMLPNPPISRNDALLQYSSAKSSKKTLQLKVVKIREFEDFSNIPTIIMALANEKSFLLDPSIKSQLTASSPRDVNQKSDVYSNLSLPSEHSAFGSTRIPNSQKSMKPNSKEPMDTRSKSVFNDILPIPTPTGPPSSAPTPLAETPKTKTMASEVLFAKEGDSPNKPIFSICLAP